MSKLKEFARLFFMVLGFMSFMAILGTVGASDLHGLELNQILVRCVPALLLLLICFVAQSALKEEEEDDF